MSLHLLHARKRRTPHKTGLLSPPPPPPSKLHQRHPAEKNFAPYEPEEQLSSQVVSNLHRAEDMAKKEMVAGAKASQERGFGRAEASNEFIKLHSFWGLTASVVGSMLQAFPG